MSSPEPELLDLKNFHGRSADSTYLSPFRNSSTGHLPAREVYPGPLLFSFSVAETEVKRNKWTYSKMLNKLYIVWDKVIPIRFEWTPTERNLVVRALPVYTDAQNMRLPVARCLIHSSLMDPTNENFEYVKHVIRSDNPKAYYEENTETERCSVVVPLGEHQPGSGGVVVTYRFMCKTICVTGMTRRPITVLFTLERADGEVLGRQKLNVKICSCPNRDMQKDENSKLEMIRRNAGLSPLAKRMKQEPEDGDFLLEFRLRNQFICKSLVESLLETVLRLIYQTPTDLEYFYELTELQKELETRLFSLQF